MNKTHLCTQLSGMSPWLCYRNRTKSYGSWKVIVWQRSTLAWIHIEQALKWSSFVPGHGVDGRDCVLKVYWWFNVPEEGKGDILREHRPTRERPYIITASSIEYSQSIPTIHSLAIRCTLTPVCSTLSRVLPESIKEKFLKNQKKGSLCLW